MIPITETALPRRIMNALCRQGLFTVEAVLEYHNTYGIKNLKGIGAPSVRELNDIILIPHGCGIPPKQPSVKKITPKKHMRLNAHQLSRFKQYFDKLCGQGFVVIGDNQKESFDIIYKNALEFSFDKENKL